VIIDEPKMRARVGCEDNAFGGKRRRSRFVGAPRAAAGGHCRGAVALLWQWHPGSGATCRAMHYSTMTRHLALGGGWPLQRLLHGPEGVHKQLPARPPPQMRTTPASRAPLHCTTLIPSAHGHAPHALPSQRRSLGLGEGVAPAATGTPSGQWHATTRRPQSPNGARLNCARAGSLRGQLRELQH
jgi:hypothetical protein